MTPVTATAAGQPTITVGYLKLVEGEIVALMLPEYAWNLVALAVMRQAMVAAKVELEAGRWPPPAS